MSATALAVPPPHLVVHFLTMRRWPLGDEKRLQAEMAEEMTRERWEFTREQRLGDGDIVDFLIGSDIAMEVKIRGSKREIWRQCERYCTHQAVRGLILASNIAFGPLTRCMGKPLWIANLGRGWM